MTTNEALGAETAPPHGEKKSAARFKAVSGRLLSGWCLPQRLHSRSSRSTTRKENLVAENEPSVEDMNKIIREQLSRRREKAPLLWPAEPRDNDDDQEDETK